MYVYIMVAFHMHEQLILKITMGSISRLEEEEDDLRSSSLKQRLPLLSLNHISFVCKSLTRSVRFYEEVLGFRLIKRPSSFNFQGAWLFNYGIGIHLLEVEDIAAKKGMKVINPKDNHISFQCSDMGLVMKNLEEMGIDYVTATVQEGGITVDQLFFHDPDGYMLEICNCQNLPILPVSSSPCPLKTATPTHVPQPLPSSSPPPVHGKNCSSSPRKMSL